VALLLKNLDLERQEAQELVNKVARSAGGQKVWMLHCTALILRRKEIEQRVFSFDRLLKPMFSTLMGHLDQQREKL
jgi:hypothetical protein